MYESKPLTAQERLQRALDNIQEKEDRLNEETEILHELGADYSGKEEWVRAMQKRR